MSGDLDIANTVIGNRTPTAPLLAPGATFGPYRIERAIGSGGMGAVYLAEAAGERVALKVIRPEMADEDGRRRMLAEGTLARRIRHPNVVRVDNLGEVDGQLYLQMEYVEGRPLRAWMTENVNRKVRLEDVAAVVRALLDGLGEVHRQGLVHRDVKPENVIVAGDPGEPGFALKIVDFGIAQAAGGKTSTAVTAIGAPLYMAPEQRTRPDAVEPSADLYSLGRMLYEMLMGALPDGGWQPPSELEPDLPKALDEVIRKATLTPPKHRFQSAAEFRAAFDAAVATPGRLAPPPLPSTPSDPVREAVAALGPLSDKVLHLFRIGLSVADIHRRLTEYGVVAVGGRGVSEAEIRAALRAGGVERMGEDDGLPAPPPPSPSPARRPFGAGRVIVLCVGILVAGLVALGVIGLAIETGRDDGIAARDDGGILGGGTVPQRPAATMATWYDDYGNRFDVSVQSNGAVQGTGQIPGVGPVTLYGALNGRMMMSAPNGRPLATLDGAQSDATHWTGTVDTGSGPYPGQLHFGHPPDG